MWGDVETAWSAARGLGYGIGVWCCREQYGLLVFIYSTLAARVPLPLVFHGLTLFLFVAHMRDVISLSTEQTL